MKMFKHFIETYQYIKEAKKRDAELTARLEASEKRIDARRRAWYAEHGMTYYKDEM